ncbi:PAS domain-containing protein [Polyangium spumosum]|nr:PAS domain-containing protein [Polyangium spumosum]
MFRNFEQVTSRDLSGMSAAEFDGLHFGAIRLDRHGTVKAYNDWEAALARRDKGTVLGKNFFTDVAPCTDVAAFRGRLDRLALSGDKSYVFDFDFEFPWGKRKVRIRFLVESDDERWVFVTDVT